VRLTGTTGSRFKQKLSNPATACPDLSGAGTPKTLTYFSKTKVLQVRIHKQFYLFFARNNWQVIENQKLVLPDQRLTTNDQLLSLFEPFAVLTIVSPPTHDNR
jgi:hypothetical protein